ncbi:MAG: hypothetical protein II851_02425 [Bacteroidales bacterium]|nr:hypothetical protein [Bacteroidales bacterium]
MPIEPRQSRSLAAAQILSMKRATITLEGEWGRCLGTIDRHGTALVWGASGSGKSNGVMMLAKELTRFGKVLYLSHEEGFSVSFQNTLRRQGMAECGLRFQALDQCTKEELNNRLFRKGSPEFVIIDSIQAWKMRVKDYEFLKRQFPNKLFILVSRAKGKNPWGDAAEEILFDVGIKIWVEGGVAFTRGRFFGPVGKAVIWPEKAFDYYGKLPDEDHSDEEEDDKD